MKVNEIGKWLFLLCIHISLYAHTPVSIEVLDENGRKTEKIKLGIPFFVDVEIVSEEHTSHPKLESDSAIVTNLQGSRSSIYTINGYRTVSKNYRYTAQAYQEGTFTIGPAIVMIGGKQEVSDVKNIVVEMNNGHRDEAIGENSVYVEISTDNNQVYKGQEVTFFLRIYMQTDDIHIEAIQEPKFSGCTAQPLEGPVTGKEIINGITYKYLEWKTKFYAHNVGTLVIPAVCSNVVIERDRGYGVNDAFDFLGMVGSILGTRSEHLQLFSNALKLDVIDLPVTDKKVTALGSFSTFTAKSNLEKAQVGEGVVLTLELIGQGNFAMIEHPALELPDGLQYYDSNMTVHQLGAGISKKDFEYIVQAVSPGTYVIPSQECVYFDKNKHMYKSLFTKPISLIITPSNAISKNDTYQNNNNNDSKISFLSEVGDVETNIWKDNLYRGLSLKHFIFLMLSLLSIVMLIILKCFYFNYIQKNAPYRSYTNAFSNALKKLKVIQNKNEYQKLRELWIELFAARLKLPVNAITQDRIERALLQIQIDHEFIKEWKDFFTIIMAMSYSKEEIINPEDLYNQTRKWLQRLDGKL